MRELSTTGRCGAASVEITPSELIGMAGYSWAGKTPKREGRALFARSLYIEDASGNGAALCFVDLMSGSRYLLEKVTELTAPRFGPLNVILAGTHTHTAPGRFYGNSYYDRMAQPSPLFQRGQVHPAVGPHLAIKIAESIRRAFEKARPARIGIVCKNVWGLSRNRSLPPFQENPEAATWTSDLDAPSGLSDVERAVDPRVTVIVAEERETSRLIGSFALFSCHSTALGIDWEAYNPDWPGVAVKTAEAELGTGAVVAVGLGAAADISPMRTDIVQSQELADFVGKKIAETIVAASRARSAMQPVTFNMVTSAFRPATETDIPGTPDARLADKWVIGAPTLGGGADGRSTFFKWGLVRDGMVGDDFPASHLQFPKTIALGKALQPLVKWILTLEHSDMLRLQALRLLDHVFVTVPGEATAVLGRRIEHAVAIAARVPAGNTRVIGYAADYTGYFTTHEEYMRQFYESASVIYGRFAGRYLTEKLQRLAQAV